MYLVVGNIFRIVFFYSKLLVEVLVLFVFEEVDTVISLINSS